jgi:acyl transferase domain-containing protein
VLVCQDRDQGLRELAAGAGQISSAAEVPDRPIVFMFPGQGSHYRGMTSDIYQNEPAFRALVDRCAALLKPHLGLDLREVLYPKTTNDERRTTNDQRRPEDRETRRQGDGEAENQHSTLKTPPPSSIRRRWRSPHYLRSSTRWPSCG